MPNDRAARCFGDCATLVRNTVTPEQCVGRRYIALEHIEEGTLRLLDVGVGEDVTSAKAEFRAGDILFGKLRPYFRKVVRPRFDGVCSTDIWVVRAADGTDQGFLYYWMASKEFVEAATRGSTGTKMPRADWDFVSRLTLPVPPPPAQRRIAAILGSLDDKIELNRRMNRTLERMAQALFKSWFIDYGPVRAKAAGDSTAGGLPAPLADLFPNRFTDSPLGPIPEGWRVVHLPDVIAVNPARSLSRGTLATYLEMSNMPTRSSRVLGWASREFTSGTKFMNGDVLVARITPCLENGKTAYVDFLDGPSVVAWGSTEYIVLRSKPPLPTAYAYLLARSDRFRSHAIANMSGTSGRQRVPPECLDRFPVIAPSDEVAIAFGEVVDVLMHRVRKNDEQSRTLARARDTLLPMLLSGEIEVSEAEAAVEEAI